MKVFENVQLMVNYVKTNSLEKIECIIAMDGVNFPISISFKDRAKLVIFFPGAFDTTQAKPKFQRSGYFDNLEYSCISFFDPTLFLSDELSVTWFQGELGKDYIFSLKTIIKDFSFIFNIENKDLLFFGSSAGGIPALKTASKFEGSNVYLGNIQTNILMYYNKFVLLILKYSFNGRKDIMDNEVLNVFDINSDINVFYAQNKADYFHFKNHFLPFIYKTKESKMKKNIVVYDDPDTGHNPISKKLELSVINAILNKEDISPLFLDYNLLSKDDYLKDDIKLKKVIGESVAMNKQHIIITMRYSLLAKNLMKSWKIGDNSFDEYKNSLFDPKRLLIKQNIFKSITLSSLKKLKLSVPDNVSFSVHILTSDELPLENLTFLESCIKELDFIEIKKHSPDKASLSIDFNNYLKENVKEGELYASVRLDDDDALSIEWLKGILYYLKETYLEHVISLCGGYALELTNDAQISRMVSWKWRFASAGMAFIGKKNKVKNISIYECGDHGITDERYITILDARKKHFIRTYNNFNDSGVSFPIGTAVKNDEKSGLLEGFGIHTLSNFREKGIRDFHGNYLVYDNTKKVIVRGMLNRSDRVMVTIKKVGDASFCYIENIGFVDIDEDGNFSFKETSNELTYSINYENESSFFIKHNNGSYFSSTASDRIPFRWQDNLKAWEYFSLIKDGQNP